MFKYSKDPLTHSLYSILEEHHLIPSEKDTQDQTIILNKLQSFLQEVAQEVVDNKNSKPEILKFYPFGSFRLGVHVTGSDIDLLCVGPSTIDVSDFFTCLVTKLENLSTQNKEYCTNITWIPTAFVPVCSFTYYGLDIDLVYAKIPIEELPPDFELFNDHNLHLSSLDSKTILSLNGSRVTDRILQAIPLHKVVLFQIALRTIKLWAKKRGIYSNKLGYLGGVSWAILVAYICCKHKECKTPADIIRMFFHWWYSWPWPKPVILRETTKEEENILIPGMNRWNPERNYRDAQHVFPILTPAHPSMNTTYNVSKFTKLILTKELTRGHEICLKFATISTTPTSSMDSIWKELLQENEFFFYYKHYLNIKVSSSTPSNQLMWLGWIESRLRHLNLLCEQIPVIEYCHIYASPLIVSETEAHFYVGIQLTSTLSLSHSSKNILDLSPAILGFKSIIQEKQLLDEMFIEIQHVPYKKLPDFVFKDSVKRPKHVSSSSSSSINKKKNITPKVEEQKEENKEKEIKLNPVPPPPPPKITRTEMDFVLDEYADSFNSHSYTRKTIQINIKNKKIKTTSLSEFPKLNSVFVN